MPTPQDILSNLTPSINDNSSIVQNVLSNLVPISTNVNNNSFIDLMRQISGNPSDDVNPADDTNSIYGHIVQMYGSVITSTALIEGYIPTITILETDILPHLDEILLADTNASIATTKASEALTSASSALASETSANASKISAAASASQASVSEANANTSAINAATSEDAAGISANSANISAITASTKASEALASATSASTSATLAAGSANSATTSATSAATSASEANSSALSASVSKDNALISANAAHTSALAAAGSEERASTSESNALTYSNVASAAADSAVNAWDSFSGIYTKSSVEPIGGIGDLWYDEIDLVMKVHNGTSWVAAYASIGDALLASDNLSDVENPAEALANLGGQPYDASTVIDGAYRHITVAENSVTDGINTFNKYVLPGDISVDSIKLNGGINTQGTIRWNANEETAELVVNDSVTYQLGEELGITIRNLSGSAIDNGRVVRITGASGDRITTRLADNSSESTSSSTFAVATQHIGNNSSGKVTISGLVRDLNTSMYPQGTALWLGTNGNYTSVKPVAPAHLVQVGWVVKSHTTDGIIFVNIVNGWELEELHNVLVTAINDKDMLQWDTTNAVWKNVSTAAVIQNEINKIEEW